MVSFFGRKLQPIFQIFRQCLKIWQGVFLACVQAQKSGCLLADLGIKQLKLPKKRQIGVRNALNAALFKGLRKAVQQPRAVVGVVTPILLELDDVVSKKPVAQGVALVDSNARPKLHGLVGVL